MMTAYRRSTPAMGHSSRASKLRLPIRVALGFAILGGAGAWGRLVASPSAAEEPEGPSFSAAGQLLRPSDYREWAYVTSGLGMTYGAARPAEGQSPRFDNVFVNRAAHREFLRSGAWPDRTMFLLEVRAAEANVSINNGGRTQGEVLALEAAVKDRGRFPDGGWAYFSFDGEKGPLEAASALPSTASCYSCHREKAAVDNTFVQFYPTLLEAARSHKTIRPGHDPGRKP